MPIMKEIFNNNNLDFVKENAKHLRTNVTDGVRGGVRYVKDNVKENAKVVQQNVKQNVNTVRRRWYMWLFPLVALAISGYLFYQYFYDHGPVIKIVFDDASVIQVERTKLRFRGVEIGTVRDVEISKDHRSVEVSVRLIKGADRFAVEGSKFWVVTPKLSLQGFTGLDTLFSGPYIEVSPGAPDASKQLAFKGRQEIDTQDSLQNTSVYLLEASNGESLSAGDAITYRGITVGSIGRVGISRNGRTVDVQVNIQNRYVHLIRSNTVFWRKVGVQADLGLFGSSIKVNSLDSIMHGGLEFATPDSAGPMAKARSKFVLAPEQPKNAAKWNPDLN